MIFKFFTHKLLRNLILIIGIKRAKNLLWYFLDKILRQTYTLGGEGEDICWLQIQSFFKSPSVIDVGANTGRTSKRFLEIFPSAKIYAIEPIPDFFKLIDEERIVSKFSIE